MSKGIFAWLWGWSWLLTGLVAQDSPVHLSVQAEAGDGVFTLLDRYGIRTDCNLAYFYRINGIKKGQGLRKGQSYQLPVLVYAYNGLSIRSTTGVDDYDWAVGVQTYNEQVHGSGLKPIDYRQDRKLWVPYSTLYCRHEPLPVLTASIAPGPSPAANEVAGVPLRGTYEIFGSKSARVPLLSTRLSGKVYYLVSGHGGADPGAVGRYGRHNLCEDEYAYDVTLRLGRLLLSHGATVYLITRDPDDGIREGKILPCDTDEQCWPDSLIPRSQKPRLIQRSTAVNTLYRTNKARGVPYQRLVIIHVDSDSRHERVDMYFYHKVDDPESLRFATYLQGTVRDKYKEVRKGRGYNGTVTPRDLHMLRETEPTSVFIELGNIRNPNDQARLVLESNRQLVANWLFDGIILDAGN
jgi:N-acetylmuramoyl-L-alanine amidase